MSNRFSADPEEVAHFARLSETWWDPEGPMRALHRLNPLRIEWLRDRIVDETPDAAGARRSIAGARPFDGLTLLDIGCGAGLLSEPMARLGARVTGLDPVERNVEIAREHAQTVGLDIEYLAADAQTLVAAGRCFDVVLAMEVIEHVPHVERFVAAACDLTAPHGLIFFSTLNRTLKSFALGIVAAEYVLRWVPRGTHRWEKFVTPQELESALAAQGFRTRARAGVVFDPIGRRWRTSRDMDINYMVAARRK
jgi:2-polyprenyl-6-hydroxyphenyl methylase / 3-demethylubiquinone-9 3-methyltransferase